MAFGHTIAWFIVAFWLGDRATAIRVNDNSEARDVEDAVDAHFVRQGSDLLGSSKELKDLKKAYEEGEKVELTLDCQQILEKLVYSTSQVKQDLHLVCIEGDCDFAKLNVDEMLVGQGTVISLVAAADHRKCLPAVLGSADVQEKLAELMSIVPSILHDAPTQEGREAVHEAYLQLVTFQEGVLALKDGLADRQKLLGFDIQEGSSCPSPCQRCDGHKSSGFGFRCMLSGRDKGKLPELAGAGVTCDAARRRWFRLIPFARQCHIADWKESALQHVHVAAMLNCASLTMLMGLNAMMSQDTRREMHRVCLKMEQGYALSSGEEDHYKAQLMDSDEVVPPGLKLALNTVFVYGMASGLAGLRAATRGNERMPALLEEGEALEPEAFSVPFTAHMHVLSEGVRALDLDMYGDRTASFLNREETMRKLETCEDIYSLKAQKTFVEGASPLVIMAMTLRNEMEGLQSQEGQDTTEVQSDPAGGNNPHQEVAQSFGQIMFTAVVGTFFAFFYAQVLNAIFLYMVMITPLAYISAVILYGVGWVASMGFGIYGIYSMFYALSGLIFKSSGAEQQMEQCLASAS